MKWCYINGPDVISVPLQLLSQHLRPVLREHFVHVFFLQPAFVADAEQRVQPPEGGKKERSRVLRINSGLQVADYFILHSALVKMKNKKDSYNNARYMRLKNHDLRLYILGNLNGWRQNFHCSTEDLIWKLGDFHAANYQPRPYMNRAALYLWLLCK